MGDDWTWDPSLYAGSAAHYVRGRVPYPSAVVELVVREAGLDGTGRLLDLGCGPDSLAVPLAPHVSRVVAVDPDPAMLEEGRLRAAAAGIDHVEWVLGRAEDVRLDGPFDEAVLAQSFHWMDRALVASRLRSLLPDGRLVFVHATTHRGVDPPSVALPFPQPPWDDLEAVVASHLGPRRRAGRGHRAPDPPEAERHVLEERVFRSAGFTGPRRHEVPRRVVERSADEIVSAVLSLSWAAPHLFGDRLPVAEAELRSVLSAASPTACSPRRCGRSRSTSGTERTAPSGRDREPDHRSVESASHPVTHRLHGLRGRASAIGRETVRCGGRPSAR